MTSPKVFVSHASEDKAFVLQLATRLRADGVDAWVDKWEILVGDRLVDKIFSEGIGSCDVFLIVLSSASVQKPWVREELDAGFVEMIERQTKLLSIKLEDCAVPGALKSRRWLNIDPKSDFETEYQELLAAVFDRRDRPQLGKPAVHLFHQVPGYSADETAVWDALVRVVVEHGPCHCGSDTLQSLISHIDRPRLRDAVDVLEQDGIVRVQRYIGSSFHAQLTPRGWHERAGDLLAIDTQEDQRQVLASLASDGPSSGEQLAARTGIEKMRLMMAIEYLDEIGLAKALRVLGGGLRTYAQVQCTVEGRRRMRAS